MTVIGEGYGLGEARRGAVTGAELVAHIDGDAPELARRIADDPASAETASEYARLQRGLRRALYRFDCPASHALGEYALRLSAAAESARIAAHLRDCLRCADEFRQIGEFMAADNPAPAPQPGERLRRLVATLLPRPGAAGAFALRGGPDPAPRTYEAEGLTITLDLAAERQGSVTLTGLLTPDGEGGVVVAAAVVLIAANGTRRDTTADEWGNFAFETVAPGDYRLEIALGDGVVTIDNLPIGG